MGWLDAAKTGDPVLLHYTSSWGTEVVYRSRIGRVTATTVSVDQPVENGRVITHLFHRGPGRASDYRREGSRVGGSKSSYQFSIWPAGQTLNDAWALRVERKTAHRIQCNSIASKLKTLTPEALEKLSDTELAVLSSVAAKLVR